MLSLFRRVSLAAPRQRLIRSLKTSVIGLADVKRDEAGAASSLPVQIHNKFSQGV